MGSSWSPPGRKKRGSSDAREALRLPMVTQGSDPCRVRREMLRLPPVAQDKFHDREFG
jgi:hypothetical protein